MGGNIALAELPDGTLMFVSDKRLPAVPSTVEYYKNQQLMMLTYEDIEKMDQLMEHELPENASHKVLMAKNILVVAYDNEDGQEPDQFMLPIIQIES